MMRRKKCPYCSMTIPEIMELPNSTEFVDMHAECLVIVLTAFELIKDALEFQEKLNKTLAADNLRLRITEKSEMIH